MSMLVFLMLGGNYLWSIESLCSQFCSSSARMQSLGPKLHPCAAAVVGWDPRLILQQVPRCKVRLSLAPLLNQLLLSFSAVPGQVGGLHSTLYTI